MVVVLNELVRFDRLILSHYLLISEARKSMDLNLHHRYINDDDNGDIMAMKKRYIRPGRMHIDARSDNEPTMRSNDDKVIRVGRRPIIITNRTV
jgi:hypothetical protein